MNGVINLKKRKMVFEKKSLRVIIPLDPAEGSRYTKPVHDYDSDDDLENNNVRPRLGESHHRWMDYVGLREFLHFRL